MRLTLIGQSIQSLRHSERPMRRARWWQIWRWV